MTSEQKEAFLNLWFGASDGGDWTHGMAGSFVDIINAQFDEAISAYTRATPSADTLAGLVRYTALELVRSIDNGYDPVPRDDGEYVLHSEATAIIDKYKIECIDWSKSYGQKCSKHEDQKRRAEAAEAKLAKYENQLPIGYITPKAQLSLLQEFSTSDSISPVKMGECRIAIYDSPAPVSDSPKAKCDRYEQTLKNIAKLSATDMSYGDQVFAVTSSRAALKVEASNEQ